MIVSDDDSERKVYDDYAEAWEEFNKGNGYAIINFKICNRKYYIVEYE